MTKERIIPCLALLGLCSGILGGMIALANGNNSLSAIAAAVVIASILVFFSSISKAI